MPTGNRSPPTKESDPLLKYTQSDVDLRSGPPKETGRMPEPRAIFTIGYEKRSIEDLIWILQARGVERVVDVRLTPFSRRAAFSMKRLHSSLEAAGITYEHVRELGNPPEIREIYLAGDAETGHRRFREHLNNGASAALDALAGTLDDQTTALLCLERDAYRCHRLVVAAVAAERLPGERTVVHL